MLTEVIKFIMKRKFEQEFKPYTYTVLGAITLFHSRWNPLYLLLVTSEENVINIALPVPLISLFGKLQPEKKPSSGSVEVMPS